MKSELLGAAVSKNRLVTLLFLAVLTGSLAMAQPPERVRVLIGFPDVPGPADEAMVEAAGGSVHHRYHLVPAIAASVPVTALDGLSRNPRVMVIEADGVVHVVDAELDNTWGVKHIGSGDVHLSGNFGDGVKVAIVDTGIDCTHPELDGNCAGGIDEVNDDSDPMDDHGHGTHVAGTVAGEDDNAGVVGVAPKALLYGIKVLSATGSGYWSNILAGIEWAVDNGIQVTNNSYGGSGYPGSIVEAAFDNSYAQGVIHIAAAGNSGNCSGTGDTVGYPAKFASVIAVAATNSSDNRACFSSTGPAVEISAPGVSVKSSTMGGGYASWSGTSMASPHVAGAAALVIASGIYTEPNDVRARLVGTADDLGAAGLDEHYGYGLVDVAEAVAEGPVNQAPTVTITSPGDGAEYDTGAIVDFDGWADDAEDGDLTASLVWTCATDGQIGTGGSFSASLSSGVHSITAEASDSGSRTGAASVTVTVNEPASPPSDMVMVTSITYVGKGGRNRNKHLNVYAMVQDEHGNPVVGATVSLELWNGSYLGALTAVSDASGRATMSLRHAPGGCYTSELVNVVAPGLSWNGVTPTNSSCN